MPIDLSTAAGRERANEVVARAMGWKFYEHYRHMRGAAWVREDALGYPEIHNSEAPPDYLSDDPALNADMLKALIQWVGRYAVTEGALCWTYRPATHLYEICCYPDDAAWDDPDTWVFDLDAPTLAEALVLALHAAGLLKEE